MKKLLIALLLLAWNIQVFAAYAYVSQVETSGTGDAITAAPSLAVTAGNLLIVDILSESASAPVLSGNGNTYNLICSGTIGATYGYFYYVQNASAGATVVTSTGGMDGIHVIQYSGIATSGAYITGSAVCPGVNSPGSGANVLTSGNSDVTSQPALFYAFTTTGAQSLATSSTAGTSPLAFTGRTPVWTLTIGGTPAIATPEDIRITTTGNAAATFGVSASGAGQYDGYIVFAAAFNEASAASASIQGGFAISPSN